MKCFNKYTMRKFIDIVEGSSSHLKYWIALCESESKPLLYHGTTVSKARSIIANGVRSRGTTKNTFGKSTSFSDKLIGTRFYDKGAVIAFEFLPDTKLISLREYQKNGQGDADAVAGGAEAPYYDREIAVFNPDSIHFIGWYNKLTKAIDPTEPVYPKGFYHNWNDERNIDENVWEYLTPSAKNSQS
jgi:hypothetical protein